MVGADSYSRTRSALPLLPAPGEQYGLRHLYPKLGAVAFPHRMSLLAATSGFVWTSCTDLPDASSTKDILLTFPGPYSPAPYTPLDEQDRW